MLNVEALKDIRYDKSLTQEQVAEHTGIAHAKISHLENGRRTNITMATLDKLADALDVEPGKLVKAKEKKK